MNANRPPGKPWRDVNTNYTVMYVSMFASSVQAWLVSKHCGQWGMWGNGIVSSLFLKCRSIDRKKQQQQAQLKMKPWGLAAGSLME